jgi:chemotaxis protein MotB
MGKKQKKGDIIIEGAPMWMATFSDMVTLLLTFFVLMLSMASFDDPAKVEAVFDSIRQGFGATGLNHNVPGTFVEELQMTPQVVNDETVNPIVAKMREAMKEHISDDLIRMTANEEEIRFRLDDRVLFKPGSTELHPAAYALLTDIAEGLKDEEVIIRVEGHTDATGDEMGNWKTSSLRSIAVVEALRERGPIPGERLEANAMGQFRPATTFGEKPEWNRRIELVLKSDKYQAVGAIEALNGG